MHLISASRQRLAAPAAALVLTSILAACGSDGGDAGGSGTTASGTASSMPEMTSPSPSMDMSQETEVDAQFLTAMVPHHQSASDMAKIAVERAQDPQVKVLAQRIIDAQGAEIAQMTQIAEAEYDTTPSTEMMGSMTHEMMGMEMTMDMAADMAMLESSPTPDKTFLEMMIPHHASALMMADEQVKRGTNEQVKALAIKIKADQAKEIGEMQELLNGLA